MSHNLGVLVIWILTVVAIPFDLIVHAEEAISMAPAADLLQAGDLIWPKKPGTVVPYNSRPGEAYNSDARRWKEERDLYLHQILNEQHPSPQDKERYSVLQKMSYHEFIGYYLEDNASGRPAPFGDGSINVGHVGIVEVSEGGPFIIEAMVGLGVRRLTYAEWLRNRPGEIFWVGRLKGISPGKRSAVAKVAAGQIGKPYDFWNFNLEKDTGFYCSKLAWFAIRRGVGLASDDNLNTDRLLWYSPKQLMKSKHVELITNPGDYGSR